MLLLCYYRPALTLVTLFPSVASAGVPLLLLRYSDSSPALAPVPLHPSGPRSKRGKGEGSSRCCGIVSELFRSKWGRRRDDVASISGPGPATALRLLTSALSQVN